MNSLPQKLEIMGLQSSDYQLRTKYPSNKIDKIKKDIWKETCKVLDNYTDKQFKDLIQVEKYWRDIETNDRVPAYKDVPLSHSKGILFRYIRENRKNLIKTFDKCKYWVKDDVNAKGGEQ